MRNLFSLLDLIHKYVRDLYGIRFPELESLVPSQLDFLRTVQVCVSVFCAKFLEDFYLL